MRIQARTASSPPAPAPRRQPIEADVRLKGTMGGDVLATGQVALNRPFMELLVKYLTRKPRSFGKSDVAWDAKSGTYKGTVQVKIKGKYTVTLDAQAKPMVDGNQPAFQLQNVGIKLFGTTIRLPFFSNWAAKLIASEISKDAIEATPAPGGIVRIDPTTLLQDVGALPYGLKMASANRWSCDLAPNGDVVLKLDGGVAGEVPTGTDRSDMAATIEKGAMMRVLGPLLGNDFQLKDIRLGENTIALDGMVEAKPLSDLINLGKGLLAAILIGAGKNPGNVSTEKAMIPLTLDLKLDGMKATMTPSLKPALGELEKTLQKAGIAYERVGDALRFDLAPLVAKYGVKRLKATPEGLRAEAGLDIPGLFKHPMLHDGARAIQNAK